MRKKLAAVVLGLALGAGLGFATMPQVDATVTCWWHQTGIFPWTGHWDCRPV